ncbi:MAG: AAA family ATPase [Eubacteriales bacterium]|nr:AAA family ATPase [Eubacteriales bacterium]
MVLEKLRARIETIDASIEEGQREIEGMHEYYWENYTEMDQYGYENFDNQQALLQQVNANQEQLSLRRRFQKMLDAPFFGRVDFLYDGDDEPESFYIGIGNFAEAAGRLPLVYDWRAPVSGLFYDYDRGPASYMAPIGELTGEITSKWQYKIRRGKMLYAFESDVKIDDEILKAELGANGEVRLKNIIRTIQKEQNAIIRNTKDKVLVIQGCAGSGKTSVALHRIAYLLYHDRKNLKSSNILILSPNSVFSNYISHILPELGEENIQEMSFDLFAYRELLDTVNDCEDRYDQIERMMREPEKARGFCEKQSHAFLGEMEEFLLLLEDELMNFQDISFKGFLMKDREIIRLFYEKFLDIPLLSRMDAVIEYFIDEYETLYNAHLDEQEQEQLREKFYRMYETRDLYLLYSRFLKEYRNERLPKLPREKRKVRFEDVYPLLYMKYRLTRRAENSRIKHLVIDEMQDYSKIQYLILRQIFPCKMTILGDRAQTIDENMQDVTRFLPDIFGKDIRKIVMNKSYRNTVEIADYAGKITGIQDIELFERHGRPVEEAVFTDMAKAAAKAVKNLRLSEDEYETAAVLVMTEEEARLAAAYMKEKLLEEGFDVQNRFSYIDKNSSAFIKGITVTTFYLAKGLEFDQVFTIYQENDNPLLSQAKYICATRALHELYMYQYTRR